MVKESAVERTLEMFTVTKKDAQAKMDLQISKGVARAAGLVSVITSMKISDHLVSHNQIHISSEADILTLSAKDVGSLIPIHRHAVSQLCTRTRMPLNYLDYLMKGGWASSLGAHNLHTLIRETPFKEKKSEEPKRFLLRRVGNCIRGFLSRSYGIHLSTDPLLQRFIEECRAKEALPIEVGLSDVRFHVKCALPYVYEVFKGQYLALGLSFHNSDFGAGKFTLRETIWDPLHGRGMIMGEPNSSLIDRSLRDRVHLGPVLEEKDLNLVATERGHRTEAASIHVKNTVQAMFSQSWIEELCFTIEKAHGLQIPWSSIVRQIGATMLKEEVEHLKKLLVDGDPSLPQLERGPDGLPIPTAWWASSAISMIASAKEDPERRIDLQEVAGNFIKKE